MTTTSPLSFTECVTTAAVLTHMQAHGRVRILDNDGGIVSGTLRHLCGPELGAYPREGDVRDCHVRVTTDTGMERAFLLRDLARQFDLGECALDR